MSVHIAWLRYCRIRHGLSQKKLGDLVGRTRQMIWRYELGILPIPEELAAKFSCIFGEPIHSFTDYYTAEISEQDFRALKKHYRWISECIVPKNDKFFFLSLPLTSEQRLRTGSYG